MACSTSARKRSASMWNVHECEHSRLCWISDSYVPASGQSVAFGSFCFAWGANSQNSSPGCNLSAAIHLWFLLFKILWWRTCKKYLKNDKNSQRRNVPCLACEMKARCTSSCTGCAHFHWVTTTSACKVQIKRWRKKRVQLEYLAKQLGLGSKLLQSAPRLCCGSILMEEPTLRGCKSFDMVWQFCGLWRSYRMIQSYF